VMHKVSAAAQGRRVKNDRLQWIRGPGESRVTNVSPREVEFSAYALSPPIFRQRLICGSSSRDHRETISRSSTPRRQRRRDRLPASHQPWRSRPPPLPPGYRDIAALQERGTESRYGEVRGAAQGESAQGNGLGARKPIRFEGCHGVLWSASGGGPRIRFGLDFF
jgi:hypothetical protein